MKYLRNFINFLATGMLIAMPYFIGCEGSGESSKDKPDNQQTNNIPDEGTNIISDVFGILYPPSGSTVPDRSIKLSGAGVESDKVSSFKVRVYYSNIWHDQIGTLKVFSDGQWDYSSIYLGGPSNHNIEATLTRKDSSTEQATVEDIVVQE